MKKRAGRGALLMKLLVLPLIVVGAAAFDAPRTCFPPKTWTETLDLRPGPQVETGLVAEPLADGGQAN